MLLEESHEPLKASYHHHLIQLFISNYKPYMKNQKHYFHSLNKLNSIQFTYLPDRLHKMFHIFKLSYV